MKIIKYFFLFILLDLSACTGCEDEIWTTLPPETQTGAQTFGCMIDGELFVGNNKKSWAFPPAMLHPAFMIEYDRDLDMLVIAVDGLIDSNDAGKIFMTINHPTPIGIQEIEKLGYNPPSTPSCREYNASANEEIFLTKFDTINKIVSGRFQFTGLCSDNTKHITQGRFDLKIINY